MSCAFSQYKDTFGTPGQGLHSYRFLGVAVVDLILSLVLAAVITYLTGFPLILSIVTVLLVGMVLHLMFGVNTSALKYLGGVSC